MPNSINQFILGISTFFLTLIIHFPASSQSSFISPAKTEYTLIKDSVSGSDSRQKSPKWVMLRSVAIPGWGQIANRQIWKVPIVYGGLGACAYFIGYNNGWYRDFKEAYILRTDDDPATIDQFDPEFGTSDYRFALSSQLQSLRDSYRRNLELSVIAFSGVYLLNVLDAYISAHLRNFDMTEDLSLKIHSPSFVQHNGRAEVICGLTLTF